MRVLQVPGLPDVHANRPLQAIVPTPAWHTAEEGVSIRPQTRSYAISIHIPQAEFDPWSLLHMAVLVVFGVCSSSVAISSWSTLAPAPLTIYPVAVGTLTILRLLARGEQRSSASPLAITLLHTAVLLLDAVWLQASSLESVLGEAWVRAHLEAGILQVLAMASFPAQPLVWLITSLILALCLLVGQLLLTTGAPLAVVPNLVCLLATVSAGAMLLGKRPHLSHSSRQLAPLLLREAIVGRPRMSEIKGVQTLLAPVLQLATSSQSPSRGKLLEILDQVAKSLKQDDLDVDKPLQLVLLQLFSTLANEVRRLKVEEDPLRCMSFSNASQSVMAFINENMVTPRATGEAMQAARAATVRAATLNGGRLGLPELSEEEPQSLDKDKGTFAQHLKEMVQFLEKPPNLRVRQPSEAQPEWLEEHFGRWQGDALGGARPLVAFGLKALQPVLEETIGDEQGLLLPFLNELDSRYLKLPYHNSFHAADVLNSMVCLLQLPSSIMMSFNPLEKLTALVAAAAHDVGHNGRTNRFHNTMSTSLALLYSDQSCLENMHCAITFILLQSAGTSFLQDLHSEQWVFLRSTFVELVLGTDLVNHLQAVNSFKQDMLGGGQEAVVQIQEPSKRKQLLKFMLKACDVGASSKVFRINAAWSCRIAAEFFNQGDEETRKGVPCSPFCDRNIKNINESQLGFFSFISRPLFDNLVAFIGDEHRPIFFDELEKNFHFWQGFNPQDFDYSEPEECLPYLLSIMAQNSA